MHVMTEAETGVTLEKAKEHEGLQRPPEAGTGKKGFFPRALEGTMALLTP